MASLLPQYKFILLERLFEDVHNNIMFFPLSHLETRKISSTSSRTKSLVPCEKKYISNVVYSEDRIRDQPKFVSETYGTFFLDVETFAERVQRNARSNRIALIGLMLLLLVEIEESAKIQLN